MNDKMEIFKEILNKYRHCRDLVNVCDLGTEEGWVVYRDALETLYLSLDTLLGGLPKGE